MDELLSITANGTDFAIINGASNKYDGITPRRLHRPRTDCCLVAVRGRPLEQE